MFWRYNLFGLLWLALILLLGLTPGKSMPEADIWVILSFDKAAHFFVFAVFTLLLIIGFLKQYQYLYLRFHAQKLAVAISIIMGVLIELIQAFIPERSLEYMDLVANSLGALIGFGCFYLVYKVG